MKSSLYFETVKKNAEKKGVLVVRGVETKIDEEGRLCQKLDSDDPSKFQPSKYGYRKRERAKAKMGAAPLPYTEWEKRRK
jgi:hypothetical protein